MPHFPKPFWRADRKRWMLQLHHGKILTLGTDRIGAFKRYHAIMSDATAQNGAKPSVVATTDETSVAVLLDQFLEWVAKNRKSRTYSTYKERLQLFLTALDDSNLTVAKLKPFHVTRFVDKHPHWSPTMRRGRMVAVQTALNWAVKEGLIDQSPIAKLQKPSAGRRDNPITESDHRKILATTKSEAFRNLLTLAWETGGMGKLCGRSSQNRPRNQETAKATSKGILAAIEVGIGTPVEAREPIPG